MQRTENAYPAHGGNLAWAEACFPAAPCPWLDLSTGINPWPYAVDADALTQLRRLPDTAHEAGLRQALVTHLAGLSPENIALAPGSEALIRLLARLRPAARVEIVTPTYGGHAEAWRGAGHRVLPIADLAAASPQADVVIAVTPNNPDGRQVDRTIAGRLAQQLASRQGWLILDEAFADLQPLAAEALPALIRLRSFGKFFGLPGLRLGFALAEPAVAARIQEGFGAWPVNALALAVATRAYADAGWIAATRQRLAAAAQRLDALLQHRGWRVAGGTDLFRLIDDPRVPRLFAQLAAQGILTRIFDYNPAWMRVGLPGAEADWTRLQTALDGYRHD